jgi:Cu-Zn family superoxide dismutase
MRFTIRQRFGAGLATVVIGATGLAVVSLGATASSASPTVARARLMNVAGQEVGHVRFERDHGDLEGRAKLVLPVDSAEFHGFHIHANNPDAITGKRPGCDPATAFTSVGGHWDVGGHTHGSHTGDLPSVIRRSDGKAEITFSIDKFTDDDLIGRAIVVHAGPDNFGNIPLGTAANQYTDNGTAYNGTGGTAATGNAGARYACGVITKR